MRRACALLSGALVAVGMTVTPTHGAFADTTAVTGPDWTVTLEYPSKVAWVDHVCQETDVYAYQGGTAGTLVSWEFTAEIRNQATGRISWYYESGPRPVYTDGDWYPVVYLCPAEDEPGVYSVSGRVTLESVNTGVTSVPYSTTFTLEQMPTVTSLSAVTSPAQTSFTGTVMAQSPEYGVIGADSFGVVALEVLTGPSWTEVGAASCPDPLGDFSIVVASPVAPGSRIRATYRGTNTSAPSVSEPQTIPYPTPPPLVTSDPAAPPAVSLPSPTVKVKSVSGRSKLKVDVNPNMGSKYWTFQVQRKNADATWKALKTYRTLGRAETRTINLPKGTYRVLVNPKFGYSGATSAEITLRR